MSYSFTIKLASLSIGALLLPRLACAQGEADLWKDGQPTRLLMDSVTLAVQPQDSQIGLLPGEFSISPDSVVRFSKGNLQYQPSSKTYRFAPHQAISTQVQNELFSTKNTNAWIDVFNQSNVFQNPENTLSKSVNEFDGDFGTYSYIANSGIYGSWHTLTKDELTYLIEKRPHANMLIANGYISKVKGQEMRMRDYYFLINSMTYQNGGTIKVSWLLSVLNDLAADMKSLGAEGAYLDELKANCNHVYNYVKGMAASQYDNVNLYNMPDSIAAPYYGIILLPDRFTQPEGVKFKAGGNNFYSSDEWEKMEEAGAVFLPYGGYALGSYHPLFDKAHFLTRDADTGVTVDAKNFETDTEGLSDMKVSARLVKYFERHANPLFSVTFQTRLGDKTTKGTATYVGEGLYDMGTEVEVTCIPDSLSFFEAWSDGETNPTRTISLTQDTVLTAIIRSKTPEFSVKITTPMYGHFVCNGTTYNSTKPYVASVKENTVLRLEAMADYYNNFVAWSDNDSDAVRELVVVSDTTISLSFDGTYIQGELNGVFSTRDGKKVHFSKGNLYYSYLTWYFTDNQYDTVEFNEYNANALFGYRANGVGSNPDPMELSENDNLYEGGWNSWSDGKGDWGLNQIYNGSNKANMWHTMTMDEWMYILDKRTDAETLRGFASIDGILGLVLLPDNWVENEDVTFVPTIAGQNKYTAEQWKKLEANGAVFMPAYGYRSGNRIIGSNRQCVFWAPYDGSDGVSSQCMSINIDCVDGSMSSGNSFPHSGCAVRLVRFTK